MQAPGYLKLMDRMNPLIVGVLHTPLLHHMLSGGLMTVSTRGRRSGRALRFPVGYDDQRDAILVLCSNAPERHWWRNFREPWPAELRVRGRTLAATGELLAPGSEEYAPRVARSFARAAFIPRMFEIDFDRERGLTPADVEKLARYAAVVRFRAS